MGKKSRVLVLHSFKDKGYDGRLEQIANNPGLDGISFSHCCIVDRDRPVSRFPELDLIVNQPEKTKELLEEIVKEEVKPLLDQLIGEFDPEVVIVHSGTIFSVVTGACLTMIINLMEKYPNLQFALQGKDEWLIERVDYTRKLAGTLGQRSAIAQNKWVEANFVKDDEIEKIIKGVF